MLTVDIVAVNFYENENKYLIVVIVLNSNLRQLLRQRLIEFIVM